MTSFALPDLLRQTILNRNISQVKRNLNQAQLEITTGRIDDLTQAANGDIGGLHLLNKSILDAQNSQKLLALAGNRADTTQRVLTSLVSNNSTLAANVLQAVGVGDQSTLRGASADAEGSLRLIFANLNTSDGGRNLFSGDKTDTSPLGSVDTLLSDVRGVIAAAPDAASAETALDTYFNDPAGGFATTIYQGGTNNAAAVELAPGVRITASVRADAQPIKDLIRNLAVVASYGTLPTGGAAERDTIVSDAALGLLQAEPQIADLRATLGVAENRISQRTNELKAQEDALTNIYQNRTARDPFEAASQLQLLQAQLQSSYYITGQLSQLSLTNFLR